ncbi:hypothetical protein NM688_g4835 [Phlebia brevispora]|uniref:Uncharacterized protein n=1 Tax=Phlebia brevispora TaxID=194682 RepID=A0ACC1T1T5_9APHY|nr:hypothetical protein NM688_g4835 [Phlebia brevispora]
MGLGNSRRGAARNNKSRLPSETGRADSPYHGSDNGILSDEGRTPTKSKGKSRANRADEAEFSMARKRTGSPSISPIKKTKKQKTGSPIARVKTDPDLTRSPLLLPVAHTNSHTKIPSKLRETSILSSVHNERRSSSPESTISSPAHSASTPSALSMQSPLSGHAKARAQNGNSVDGRSKQRVSPPVRQPTPVNRIEHEFLIDVDGEETGSSTDSDSS